MTIYNHYLYSHYIYLLVNHDLDILYNIRINKKIVFLFIYLNSLKQ